MELMTNFIGTMKNVVNIKGFKRVPIIAQDKVYESTVALYDPSKLVVLVELLVELQWQSK